MSRGLKKIDAITIAVLFGCVGAIGLWLLCSPVVFPDDIWLYAVCQNIKNGEVIYRDFSVVTTPLFYLVYALPLFVCDTYFSFKLTNILIAGIYLVWIYYICEKINIYKGVRMFFVMFACAYFLTLGSSPEYNVMAQLFISGAVYVTYMIYKDGCSIGRCIWLAVLLAAAVLTKYTVGAFIACCAGLLLIFFACIRKIRVRDIFTVIAADAFLAALTAAALAAFGALNGFFECLFAGVGSFSRDVFNINHILNSLKTSPLCIIISIAVFAVFILCLAWKARVIGWFLLFLLADIIVIYPIPNQFHMNLVCIPAGTFLIIAARELSEHMLPKPVKRLKYKRQRLGCFTCMGVLVLLIAPCAVCVFTWMLTKDNVSLEGTRYYDAVSISKEQYDKIDEMLDYMDEHPEFSFYSPEEIYSCIESIHGNTVDGKWNCMLQGNIGSDSVTDRIRALEGQEDVRIYIYSDPDDMFWQSFSEAEDYVREHYEFVENVGIFDVYNVK